jgi:predicted transcriptional regulator
LQSDAKSGIVHQRFGGEMTERPRKATRLTVSLEEQDYRMLNEIALARDASLSWVIRQAIRQFIENSSKPGEKRETRHGDGARGRR